MKPCVDCKEKMVEEKYSTCYDCFVKDKETQPKPDSRQNSIERQSAIRSVAIFYQGRVADENAIRQMFSLFLEIIRGK